MLKRLVIENYRSCVRTSLDLHPSLSVLIGPNGSGKTNILHSVMLLNKLTGRGDTLRSRAPVGGSSRIIASFQVGPGTAQLRVSFDPYKSETSDQRNMFASQKWDLKAQNGNRFSLAVPLAFPAVVGAEWPRVDWRKYYYQRFAVPSRMRLRGKGQHEHIIPLWAARMMLRVAEFCTRIKYYSASQFTNPLSCPASFGIEDGRPPRFFRQRGHVRFLYDMYSAEQSGKDGRFGRFMDIVSPHGLGLIDRLSFQKVRTSSANYSVKVGGKLVVRKSNTLLIIPRFKIGRLILSPKSVVGGYL